MVLQRIRYVKRFCKRAVKSTRKKALNFSSATLPNGGLSKRASSLLRQAFSTFSRKCLPTVERGKVQIGSEILSRISRKFGKSIERLLTGEDQKSNCEEIREVRIFS
jgi:hypothetical protein